MTRLKRYFITLYLAFLVVALFLGVFALFDPASAPLSGLALILAAGAPLVFFGWLLIGRPARTAVHPLAPTLLTGAGVVLIMLQSQSSGAPTDHFFWLAATAFVGWYAYVRWYSRLPRPDLPHLQPGQPLPPLTLERPTGQWVDSSSFHGHPHVLIFYRGNWCPLCMAQIQEVAQQWRELERRGAIAVLISPQPQTHTAQLAQRFDIPMQFLCDPGAEAARRLAIDNPGGLPLGMEVLGYDSDVVLPTVIIIDADSIIRYAHITDNYRVRPEPETFLKVLDQIRSEKTASAG